MTRAIAVFIISFLIIALAGCAGDSAGKPAGQSPPAGASEAPAASQGQEEAKSEPSGNEQTEPSGTAAAGEFSASEGLSVKLPEAYPSDEFPIYDGSYIYTVMEVGGAYTVVAYSRDEAEKVIAFYEKALADAEQVISATKTENSLTSFGTKGGYTYTLDVGPSDEMEGYKTSISIFVQKAG